LPFLGSRIWRLLMGVVYQNRIIRNKRIKRRYFLCVALVLLWMIGCEQKKTAEMKTFSLLNKEP
jgi:hypothetical protein